MRAVRLLTSKALPPFIGLLLVSGPIFVGGAAQAENREVPGPGTKMRTAEVTLGGKTIRAVIAETDSARAAGLLGWESITDADGMLLDFGLDGPYAIHMQGMKFPIDALWIDGRGVIRLIYSGIVPNSGIIYPSMFPCRYCLEVKAGFCKKYDVRMDQRVRFGVVGTVRR